jgi:hypothetical protein
LLVGRIRHDVKALALRLRLGQLGAAGDHLCRRNDAMS